MEEYTTFDNSSKCNHSLMNRFVMDFRLETIPTIGLVIQQLKKWILYFETKFNYPSKCGHKLYCSSINNFDWSMIKLPNKSYNDVIFIILYLYYNFSIKSVVLITFLSSFKLLKQFYSILVKVA